MSYNLTDTNCCGLFPEGLNLIILKEPDDDVIDKYTRRYIRAKGMSDYSHHYGDMRDSLDYSIPDVDAPKYISENGIFMDIYNIFWKSACFVPR